MRHDDWWESVDVKTIERRRGRASRLNCGRVEGWRAMHAISLGHWIGLHGTRVRAGAEVAASPRLAFRLNQYLQMSITAKPKRRGRPATGRDPMMGFRAAPVLRASIVKWAESQPDMPTLSEATRRLVELGLTVKQKVRSTNEGQKLRAREMAGKAIDKMTDTTAAPDDQATRKRRLLKGPEEFRGVRVDRSIRKT